MKHNREIKEPELKLPKHMGVVWLQGFINGRTGTAAVNANQVVQSGYVHMLQKKYEAYVAAQMELLDKNLHELCAEAEKLLIELKQPIKIFPEIKPAPSNASAVEKRLAERIAANISSKEIEQKSKRKKALDRLIDIRTAFSQLETACQEELLKTAAEIEAVLATYCKGVMFRVPITKANIPTINISATITQFHKNVEWTNVCLKRIDKEVQQHHED